MDRERERERKHHVRGARRKGRPGRRGDHSFIPASREVASVPLIQFIGGWKWYPVLSRGLTMEAGTDG
jgi:hypothetical protein